MKIAVLIIAYNEEFLIRACLEQFKEFHRLVLIPRGGEHDKTFEIARDCGAEVIEGYWRDEAEQRNWGLARLYDYDYVLIVDPDEFYTKEDKKKLLGGLNGELCYRANRIETYWRDLNYKMSPEDSHKPIVAMSPKFCWFMERRIPRMAASKSLLNYQPLLDITMHHVQWYKPEKRIKQKLKLFEHKHKFDINKWWKDAWLNFKPGETIIRPWSKEKSVAEYSPTPKEIWNHLPTME